MPQVKRRRPSEGMSRFGTYSTKEGARTSLDTRGEVSEVYHINIGRLLPFRDQARKTFSEEGIRALAETVRVHGIQQPLTVLKSSEHDGSFEVVSGERRLRAAKFLGMEKVPCRVMTDINAAREIAVIENIQREDLTPIELGRAYIGLLESGVCASNQEVAQKLGLPKSHVSEHIHFAQLPETVQEKLTKSLECNRKVLRKLKGMASEKEMLRFLDRSSSSAPRSKNSKKTLLHIKMIDGEIHAEGSSILDIDPPLRSQLREHLLEWADKLQKS